MLWVLGAALLTSVLAQADKKSWHFGWDCLPCESLGCHGASGVLLGGSGVSIGGFRILRVAEIIPLFEAET